jgi:nitrogen-specific signal transduction histidine kinase
MNSLRVEASYDGDAPQVVVREDWFRQVLLNLLLNSLDAFAEARSRSRRVVRLSVAKLNPKDRFLRMRFIDTATGVLHHRLSSFDPTRPWQAAVFELGVTSKRDGTGWGLFLCRRVMGDHGGSIDLLDGRGGATFELRLPVTRVVDHPDQAIHDGVHR